MTDTMSLGGSFPVITFDKLPAGMERGAGGGAMRSKYDWAGVAPKQGIKVPGDKYLSASSSAQTFAKNHPLDDKAEKAIALHIAAQVRKAKAEAEKAGTPWTDDMEKAIQPDPSFVQSKSRTFATEAVKNDAGEIIRTKGYETKSGQKLADEYYIIRVN